MKKIIPLSRAEERESGEREDFFSFFYPLITPRVAISRCLANLTYSSWSPFSYPKAIRYKISLVQHFNTKTAQTGQKENLEHNPGHVLLDTIIQKFKFHIIVY